MLMESDGTPNGQIFLVRVGLFDPNVTGGTNEETYPVKVQSSKLGTTTVKDFFADHCKTTFGAKGKHALSYGLSVCIAQGLDHTGIVANDVVPKDETLHTVWQRFSKFSRFIFKINAEKKKGKGVAKVDKGEKKSKAPSAYILFCKQKRPLLAAANPNVPFGTIGRLLGEAWKKANKKVCQADFIQ